MTEIRSMHPPKGWYRARTARDAASLERDGEPFYEANHLQSSTEALFEVRFADGIWMLAHSEDLDWARER